MSGYLTLADGSHRTVHDGFSIGRVVGCDLVIDDTKASRRHARLVVAGGVVEIEDLDSSNGTLLNDKPVQRRMLRDGDQVKIGKTVLVYHEGTAPAAARGASGPATSGPVPFGSATNAALDGDDDLLADGPSAAPPVPTPAPLRVPPPAPRPAIVAALPPPAVPPTPAPTPAPPSKAVVEFADEVVEVRRAAPAAPSSSAAKPAGDGKPLVTAGSRVLQFHKQESGGGLLGDDLGQLSGGTRTLLFVGVLVVSAGLVWLVMTLVR